MKILICLIVLIVLLMLVRIRFSVYYDGDGMRSYLKILAFKIKIPPDKKKVKTKKTESAPAKKGGSLDNLKVILTPAVKTLGRAVSFIRIDKLAGKITLASDDAFKTAMMFGGAAAGAGILLPILENNFKIKKKDIEVNADFEATEPMAKLTAHVSIAVWQVLALGVIFTFNYIKIKKGMD